ncbi:glutaredoxin family protein [Aerococcus mictus]|nr:glutaredoxin family protein [Aerococcus mictus]
MVGYKCRLNEFIFKRGRSANGHYVFCVLTECRAWLVELGHVKKKTKGSVTLIMIKVYSKTVCGGCDMVKHYLDMNKLDYTVINLDEDQEAMDLVQSKGIMGVPIVVVNDDWERAIVGFNPVAIDDLIKG